jgi:endonuclease G, mitochondrial
MIPASQIQKTIDRFRERTAPREEIARKLSTGSAIAANAPERLERRIARIMAQEAGRGPAPMADTAVPAATASVLERILGRNDLMSITFLESAVAAARTVARIEIRSQQRTVGYGTGSLVAPRILLTNNHVLGSEADAATSLAEFEYQDGVAAPTVFELDPASFFVTDPALDYTMVAVRERGTEGADLRRFGFNRLIEQEGKILIGEYLNIVQHPNGDVKQVALRENQLKDILPEFLHYQTDTAPGSSGSPVFNDQWELVALHHSGVPHMDAHGRYLTIDGMPWEPAMGEHRIHWVANEGARVSRIVAHLKDRSLSGVARSLRDSVFSGELTARSARSSPAAQPPGSSGTVRISPDGTATWTVPIQITVRVGDQPAVTAGVPAATADSPLADTPRIDSVPSADLQSALDAVDAGARREYYDREKDEADRAAYYAGIDTSLSQAALFQALSELLTRTHARRPAYKPAVHVYPFVDLHPDRKLRSIYSQKVFEAEELVREDFRIEDERAQRLQERLRSEALSTGRIAQALDLLEAQLPFNCEHVVPQSWFEKDEPMRGDLHHLFACEPGCNSFRGNTPYFDFPDFEEAIRDECGKRDGTRFEPGAAKGIVARATLYFLLRYPARIRSSYDAGRLSILLGWHDSHPVTEYELHRNMAIVEKQGNRSPLIDHPAWARAIDFTRGL